LCILYFKNSLLTISLFIIANLKSKILLRWYHHSNQKYCSYNDPSLS
jgi:hypothetical protein